MTSIKTFLLSSMNSFGRLVPKAIQRRIADYPGVLTLFERLSHDEFIRIRTPEGFQLLLNPLFHANLVASGDLGDYEPEIRNLILSLARPGMTAYDIGANVGVFSFLLSSIVQRGIVYAFEPEKNNYTCFEKSLAINGCRNIVLDKRAIGKAKGIGKFDRRGGAFSGRLVDEGMPYHPTENIDPVETVSLDYLIEEEGFRTPDIVKIDVEGNEYLVLEGMKKTIDIDKPIIICELHTHLGEKSEDVIDFLSGYGYSISSVKSMAARQNNSSESDDLSGERHIVAVKHRS